MKARGQAITTAIDVAEITRSRFLKDLKVSKIARAQNSVVLTTWTQSLAHNALKKIYGAMISNVPVIQLHE